jgi:hypothetical protein
MMAKRQKQATTSIDDPGRATARAARRGSGTKAERLVSLLSCETGVDLATLGKRLGWQVHSVRAAISGLRKAGHAIVVERSGDGGPSRYRILPPAPAGQGA